MTADRQTYEQRVLAFIGGAPDDFDSLAAELFAYQFEHNASYRCFCQRAKVSPDSVRDYTQIPTVTADLFRLLRLYSSKGSGNIVFRTSGTTSGARGEHHLQSLDVYRAGVVAQVSRYLLADGKTRPALALAPSPAQLPDSSLSAMLGMIGQHFTGGDAVHAWHDEKGLDLEVAVDWLLARDGTETPVQVLATSAALVYLLDELKRRSITLQLPIGSVLMPTGGNKGKTRDFDQNEIEDGLCQRLGLAPRRIITEYGMTELVSQFWDPVFADELDGRSPKKGQRTVVGPPWCRVDVVDPRTMKPLADGKPGILVFTDLANIDSVARIQTADIGTKVGERADGSVEIRLRGRAPGSGARGCSLTAEESGKRTR